MSALISIPTPSLEAARIVDRIERLGIAANVLVDLAGTSKAQLSRFFAGQTRLPAAEVEKLNDAIDVLEDLFRAFYPFKPDLRNGDVTGPLVRDYSKGLIRVSVEDDYSLLRKHKRTKVDGDKVAGGFDALAEGIK